MHVAASYDGKTARLYLNGVPAGEKDATTQNLFGETIEIGQAFEKRKNAAGEAVDTATGFFQGMIDDVRIYNSALTPAEVAALATGS